MADISVLQKLIDDGAIGRTLKKDTTAKTAVSTLQEVLYHLGFGKKLKWQRFGVITHPLAELFQAVMVR